MATGAPKWYWIAGANASYLRCIVDQLLEMPSQVQRPPSAPAPCWPLSFELSGARAGALVVIDTTKIATAAISRSRVRPPLNLVLPSKSI